MLFVDQVGTECLVKCWITWKLVKGAPNLMHGQMISVFLGLGCSSSLTEFQNFAL